MSKPHRCLHCHLIGAANEWSLAYGAEPNGHDPRYYLGQSIRFVCDMVIQASEPGDQRVSCANAAMIGLAELVSDEIDTPRSDRVRDGPPTSGLKH